MRGAAAAGGTVLIGEGALGAERTGEPIVAAARTLEPNTNKRSTVMSKPSAYFAYVGSFTTKERNARGEGISVFRVDATSGSWTPVQVFRGLVNPSYLAFDRTRQFLYAVHGDLSDISAFAIDSRSGKLSFINKQSTAGKNPVHLTIDSGNRFAIVANHISSTVAVLARNADGSLGGLVDQVQLTGTIGPHRIEQPFSKPHHVELDHAGQFLIVPDKGLDRVFTFRFDSATGKLTPAEANAPKSREGAGPRHVAFHPQSAFAYVLNELDSTVTAYRFNTATGALSPFQVLSSLPDTFVGDSRAAEIAISPQGNFLYASNRGHDSVAVFAIDRESGRLSAKSWEASRGKTPRFFTLDLSGRLLFVANEESDSIVTFTADSLTGQLSVAGEAVKTGSPVCIILSPIAA